MSNRMYSAAFFEVGSFKVHIYSRSVPYRNHFKKHELQ